MKVPKLKNIRVRSRYDGMGTIEQIYTASNKSMKVNFDNGAKKSFTIPLAFNSGLLSSDNKFLSDYISFLNQNDAHSSSSFPTSAIPNGDIPSSIELGITLIDKYALTRQRLAILGALDDFYQLYVDVYNTITQHMIEHSKDVFNSRHENYNGEVLFYFPEFIKVEVRKLFEPLLNKYLYLFSNEYDHIFASAYAFEHFNFFYTRGMKYIAIPFDDFCKSIEDVYIDILYKWKSNQNPNIMKSAIFKLVNARIQILTALEQKKILLPLYQCMFLSSK